MRLYGEATTFDENALTEEFNTKRQNFTSQPVPPYAIGDLWTQGETGDIMVCRFARYTGGFSEDDWEPASKYTDDSALENWRTGDYADNLEEIQGQIDSKAETWYQAERPDINESWSAEEKAKHIGDLWYNTTANTTWRYNGTTWVQQNVPTAVFDAIDGKAQVFTGNTQPANPSEGDLWFKSADDPIKTYVNNSWVEYNKYTDDTLAKTKNRTFIQSSSNVPTPTAIGDLWIVTDDDNHQKRWNGTSWESIRDGTIAEAAGTADNFITENSNGIFVHRDGESDDPADGTGVWITDAVSIIRNGLSYIWAGVENAVAKVRIGLANSGHIMFSSSGMEVYKDADTRTALFAGDGVTLGPTDNPTFTILNDDTMRLSHKYFTENFTCLNSQTVSRTYYVKFDVYTILSVRVHLFEISLQQDGGASNTYVTLNPSKTSETTSFGKHTVSYTTNGVGGRAVTISVTNTNSSYKAVIHKIEIAYNSQLDGLSKITCGASPKDSDEYSFAAGNGFSGNSSNAFAVDWLGNSPQQMSIARLVANDVLFDWGNFNDTINCDAGMAHGECFDLYGGYSTSPGIPTKPDFEIKILKDGYYLINVEHVWSSVSNVDKVKGLGIYRRNGQLLPTQTGLMAYGRGDSWNTINSTFLVYLYANDYIGLIGRDEGVGSTMYVGQMIIRPAWFV